MTARAVRLAPAVLLLVLLSACGGGGGSYPPPTTRYEGRTAAEWGADALDVSWDRSREASACLRELKAEGVPFLLAAVRHHLAAGNASCLNSALHSLDMPLVATPDLAIIASILDPAHDARLASEQRSAALVLSRAGSRAKPWLPQMRRIANLPQTPPAVRDAVASIDR